MHLGIVVVYLVKRENEELLALHLRKIRTLTKVPYTLYAGIDTEESPFISQLEKEPCLRIVPLPRTRLKGGEQHAFYLKHIIQTAVSDDVTHVVIMHVDSFPVREDWVDIVTGKLEDPCVLSTISHNHYLALYTACLCFRKDFYVTCQPEFLLTESEHASEAYRRFSRSCNHYVVDSGVGFVFTAFRENLTWVGLERSNRHEDHGWYGSIYADAIFHLVGAYRRRQLSHLDRSFRLQRLYRLFFTVVNAMSNRVKGRVPGKLWDLLRYGGFPIMLSQPSQSYEAVLSQLLNDPDEYLNYLRGKGVKSALDS